MNYLWCDMTLRGYAKLSSKLHPYRLYFSVKKWRFCTSLVTSLVEVIMRL